MITNKDGKKVAFEPTTELLVPYQFFLDIIPMLQQIEQEDGHISFKKYRYEYVHKETGEVASKKVKKEDLDANYVKRPSFQKTAEADWDTYLSRTGASVLDINSAINRVFIVNADAGIGKIIEEKPEEEAAEA